MNQKHLVTKVRKYVTLRFSEPQGEALAYHNLEHTLYVAKATMKIAADYKLAKQELLILEIAALFHDIGVLEQVEGHEQIGVATMRKFMENEHLEEELIVKISSLIMATKLPQNPKGLLEAIICDADLFHLGKKIFLEKSENLKKESEVLQNKVIDNASWFTATLAFMELHRYQTVFCITELDAGKTENIKILKNTLKLQSLARSHETLPSDDKIHEGHRERDKDKPEKGIETMFRITSSNNQRMSDMADNKAHLLITVNSIILSAIISLVLRKLDANTYLAYPTFLLLAVSLAAMTFSILATRPSIPSGMYSESDFERKEVNLLFFGNFYKMPLEVYQSDMMKIMDDKDFLYHTLIRDVYGQGAVLGKKYRLLRLAYSTFMYGLILSVLTFIIVSAAHYQLK